MNHELFMKYYMGIHAHSCSAAGEKQSVAVRGKDIAKAAWREEAV
jgi:hypothetical protein